MKIIAPRFSTQLTINLTRDNLNSFYYTHQILWKIAGKPKEGKFVNEREAKFTKTLRFY